jgi:hypothetical protein
MKFKRFRRKPQTPQEIEVIQFDPDNVEHQELVRKEVESERSGNYYYYLKLPFYLEFPKVGVTKGSWLVWNRNRNPLEFTLPEVFSDYRFKKVFIPLYDEIEDVNI